MRMSLWILDCQDCLVQVAGFAIWFVDIRGCGEQRGGVVAGALGCWGGHGGDHLELAREAELALVAAPPQTTSLQAALGTATGPKSPCIQSCSVRSRRLVVSGHMLMIKNATTLRLNLDFLFFLCISEPKLGPSKPFHL